MIDLNDDQACDWCGDFEDVTGPLEGVLCAATGQRCGSASGASRTSRTTMASPVAKDMVVRDGTKRERLRVLEVLPGGVARCVDSDQQTHFLPMERLRVVTGKGRK